MASDSIKKTFHYEIRECYWSWLVTNWFRWVLVDYRMISFVRFLRFYVEVWIRFWTKRVEWWICKLGRCGVVERNWIPVDSWLVHSGGFSHKIITKSKTLTVIPFMKQLTRGFINGGAKSFGILKQLRILNIDRNQIDVGGYIASLV